MKKTIIVLPIFYSNFLINGCLDNYSDKEIAEMKEIKKKNGFCVDIDFNTQDFKAYNGLGCEVAEFTFFK